jgi:hypothetical protein
MPLDPYNLTPNASINRVKLLSAPGLPAAWQGKTAFQIMGRESLVRRIVEAFPELTAQTDPIPAFCQHYLAQQIPVAEAIADEMGLALGCVLMTLKRGEADSRAARPDWDESYWTHWGSIQHVILGGGLMASLLGAYMLAKASKMLNGLLSLTKADYPAALPLIGAARMAAESTGSAWIFDFGGTNVKRALATYVDAQLMALKQMQSILIPASVFGEAKTVFDFMVQAVVDTISQQDHPNEMLFIYISIANYARQCQLASDNPYGQLNVLGMNPCHLLSDAISQQIGCPITLEFVHDGTAAAKTYAGASNTAVITVGTSLGMGFPPPPQSLIPLSSDFRLNQLR